MIKGLLTLIRERFSLVQYGPMILVFVFANALYFSAINGLSVVGLVLTFIILFSAFLRLRLFDEIKDYEVDLKINPTRPLARGILSRDQVKVAILVLIFFELLLSSFLGLTVFFVHILAIAYSLLMFEEFFIGTHLRPHLTTYAISHTFVSVLFATTAAVGSMKNPLFPSDVAGLLFLGSNWMFFNLFEFARKTYSKSEERTGVDTYTSLFGIPKAVFLSLSQVVLGLGLLSFSLNVDLRPLLALAVIYILISFIFIFSQTPKWARLFRHTSGLYLLLHYIVLAWLLGKDLL